MSGDDTVRATLAAAAHRHRRDVVEMAKWIVAARSDNPPGDTRRVADAVAEIITPSSGVELTRHLSTDIIMNLVMRVRGGHSGRRLVFNGHLDTFPLGDAQRWTTDPSGEERDGRLYGLGVSDMKGGLAAILFALQQCAAQREALAGEIVATFAGDEESMGVLGTQFLLDAVPHARGDAMVSGDAGSPRVLRFGEKGMIWLSRARRNLHADRIRLPVGLMPIHHRHAPPSRSMTGQDSCGPVQDPRQRKR